MWVHFFQMYDVVSREVIGEKITGDEAEKKRRDSNYALDFYYVGKTWQRPDDLDEMEYPGKFRSGAVMI